jgi:hypothetical protein
LIGKSFIPKKPQTSSNKMERIGYGLANKLHKIGVLTLVSFIGFNIFLFGKEYNAHWRARRVIYIIILYIKIESKFNLRNGEEKIIFNYIFFIP